MLPFLLLTASVSTIDRISADLLIKRQVSTRGTNPVVNTEATPCAQKEDCNTNVVVSHIYWLERWGAAVPNLRVIPGDITEVMSDHNNVFGRIQLATIWACQITNSFILLGINEATRTGSVLRFLVPTTRRCAKEHIRALDEHGWHCLWRRC